VRVRTLDKEVERCREELEIKEVEGGFLTEPEPWPEPVDGNALLTEIYEVIGKHIIVSKACRILITLWVIHAHAHNAARHSPILFVTSPTKRCGKTNLLNVLAMLVPKALSAANVTPATIFRAIDLWHPTMLIDEVDTFLSDKSELRGVLNSGHTRAGAYVVRCVGDQLVPKLFSTWAPKTFAAIGGMHPTLEDRSIKAPLKRKLRDEKVERIPKDADAYQDLRRKCARWVSDHFEALKTATPALPEMNDRARDNWEPLLAIADACDGDWATLAREAALQLSGVDEDETYSILLLEDLKKLFREEKCEKKKIGLSSTHIVGALGCMEDRPWPEFANGKPISARAIAKLLKPFNIFPKQIKTHSGWGPNGYEPGQFTWAFRRYLSPGTPKITSETPKSPQSQSGSPKKTSEKSTTFQSLKKARKPSATGVSEVSEDKNPKPVRARFSYRRDVAERNQRAVYRKYARSRDKKRKTAT
jgi:putative DNA primase/helicase